MSFDLYSLGKIHAFYEAISPWETGYQQNSFAYVATKHANNFVLCQGILWLNPTPSKFPFTTFKSDNICAGQFKLADVGKNFPEFIDDLRDGAVVTPRRTLMFPTEGGQHHRALFTPLHPSALPAQSRVNVLKLTGAGQILRNEPSVLDWELRSAATPFNSVNQLLSEYGLGGIFTDALTVEVVATAVMGFNGDASKISGETATIVLQLANTLDMAKASVGYRVISQGKVVRGSLTGSQFLWKQTDDMQIGTFDLKVTKAAILHCYALYNKVAQTHWYITDPTTSQNSRRVIFRSFDTGLAILNEFLGRSHAKGRDARDFEVGVAWLFWMLGFGTLQLGSTARTQDFSDVVLITPQGHIAIVECTTGLLRADSKLQKLVARASTVRRRLDRSSHAHLKLLPIMISTLTRQELQADLEDAEKLGVLVMAREELDQLVPRTAIGANTDELFSNAEQRVRQMQEALKSKAGTDAEPELPLS